MTDNKQPPVIDSHEALITACDELNDASVLGVDTEFMRVRTYHPVLCLIQIFDGHQPVCVDALAIDDLTPLFDLFDNPTRPLLFHSARQDFETFYVRGKRLPHTLYDTQIAAALCGPSDQLSYAQLVNDVTGVELPKSQTRTNWAKRPLTPQQLLYAADDVRYLPPLMEYLNQQLDELGRRPWFEAECVRLLDHQLYEPQFDEAWRRCKSRRNFSDLERGAWRALCSLREHTAIKHDMPRRWVIEDPAIEALAVLDPSDSDGIVEVLRGAKAHRGLTIEAIAEAIAQAEPVTNDRPDKLDAAQTANLERAMKQVRNTATQLNVAPSVLATRRDIESLVRGNAPALLTQGWRHEVIGGQLIELIS